MYKPQSPDAFRKDPSQFRYLKDEFARIERTQYDATDFLRLNVQNAAPSKYSVGTIVYADGTNWNPGSGEGVYVWKASGVWAFLG